MTSIWDSVAMSNFKYPGVSGKFKFGWDNFTLVRRLDRVGDEESQSRKRRGPSSIPHKQILIFIHAQFNLNPNSNPTFWVVPIDLKFVFP